MEEFFYSGSRPLLRTLVIAALAYPAMLLLVRISGHRTLARMNAFDLIVTIALGSTLASVITSEDLALAQGVLAFSLLVGMQFAITFLARRFGRIERIVNGDPTLLFFRGSFVRSGLDAARLTESEVVAAMRSHGSASLEMVEAVVLETNGQVSVVMRHAGAGRSAPEAGAEVSTLRTVPRAADGDPDEHGRLEASRA